MNHSSSDLPTPMQSGHVQSGSRRSRDFDPLTPSSACAALRVSICSGPRTISVHPSRFHRDLGLPVPRDPDLREASGPACGNSRRITSNQSPPPLCDLCASAVSLILGAHKESPGTGIPGLWVYQENSWAEALGGTLPGRYSTPTDWSPWVSRRGYADVSSPRSLWVGI